MGASRLSSPPPGHGGEGGEGGGSGRGGSTAARASRAPRPLDPVYRALTLALVALVTIVAFEGMAISTIMPTVADALDAEGAYASAFSAMFTAQLLAIVLAQPWIETSGPAPVMRWGQVAFALGCALAGLAPTFGVFLAGRVLAGLGAGFIVVALYVVIGAVYPEIVRPRVFAWVSAAWVLPSIIGPLVAAAISAAWSWRGVFLLVVPAVAVTLTALARTPAADTRPRPVAVSGASARPGRAARRSMLLGAGVTAGAGIFQWAGAQLVPPRALPWLAAAAGIGMLALTVPRVLPPGALRLARGLPSVVLARGLFTAAFNGAVSFVPLWLVTHRGMSTAAGGLVLAFASFGWALGAWIQGRDRLRESGERLVVAGALCVVAGVAGYALLAALTAPPALAVLAGAVLGLGMGMGTTSQAVLMLRIAPVREHAAASSGLTLADTLGSAVGISLTGAVYASLAHRPADVAFPAVWAAATACALLGLLAARRVRVRRTLSER